MKRKISENELRNIRRYSETYDCTIAEAIADRDYPLTSEECRELLIALGVDSSECSVYACRPDSDANVARSRAEFDESVRR